MPDPIPAVPPSTEQIVQGVRTWIATPLGKQVVATGVPTALAESMTRHCPDVDERLLGEALIRLASHLSGTASEDPEMPLTLMVNLVGAAGADLIDRGADRA